MNLTPLTRTAAPWLHHLTAAPADLSQAARDLYRQHPRLAVRVVRGGKCPTPKDLFDECAAALQFPLTFGDNWDAFHDCLTDLAWLESDGCVLFLADADRLLSRSSAEQADNLRHVLTEAVQSWNQPERGPARPFHVVFHARPGEEKDLLARWQDAASRLHKLA